MVLTWGKVWYFVKGNGAHLGQLWYIFQGKQTCVHSAYNNLDLWLLVTWIRICVSRLDLIEHWNVPFSELLLLWVLSIWDFCYSKKQPVAYRTIYIPIVNHHWQLLLISWCPVALSFITSCNDVIIYDVLLWCHSSHHAMMSSFVMYCGGVTHHVNVMMSFIHDVLWWCHSSCYVMMSSFMIFCGGVTHHVKWWCHHDVLRWCHSSCPVVMSSWCIGRLSISIRLKK